MSNFDFAGKKIVLGVTGSIAAYKSAELVRCFEKHHAQVKVVMTKSAMQFIQPLLFSTLTKNKVYTDMFDQNEMFDHEHINLAKWADCIVIAPATANIIAKLSHGIADDLLSSVCLAYNKNIYIAPAMNKEMWGNTATQENIQGLEKRQFAILGPASGTQACGDVGLGRMIEPNEIINQIAFCNNQGILSGLRLTITAGPTIEPIDPVRFISNRSSGKMGYAIAQAAINQGATVTLISGPTALTPPKHCNRYVQIKTANDMYSAVMEDINKCDIFISTAAVSDYRAKEILKHKMKRSQNDLTLNLSHNVDILASVANLESAPLTVGFAAETENIEEHASQKLHNKKVDIIVANLVGEGLGFDADDNELLVLSHHEEPLSLTKKHKNLLARELMEFIASFYKRRFSTCFKK